MSSVTNRAIVSADFAAWSPRALAAIALGIALAGPRASAAQPTAVSASSIERLYGRLVAAAQRANADLAAARAARAAARAQRDAAGFAPPLALQASVSDAPRGDIAAGNAQLEVRRDLFLGATSSAARATADAEVAAADVTLEARRRELTIRVLVAFARAAGSQRTARRLVRSDRLLTDAEEALRTRFAAGDARYMDVLRVRTERMQTRSQLSEVRANGASARASLDLLAGQALDADAMTALLDDASSDALAAGWVALFPAAEVADSLVALFPGVRRAVADEGRALAAVLRVRAAERPQVSAAVGVQRIGPANGGTALGLTFGLSSTLPFTASASNAYRRTAADLTLAAARADYTSARARAGATLRAGVARYEAARERLGIFDGALLVAAESERETALAHYRAGSLSLVELLDFERALLRVEMDRARAIVDAADARATLAGVSSADAEPTP